jgi:hypothetical protein
LWPDCDAKEMPPAGNPNRILGGPKLDERAGRGAAWRERFLWAIFAGRRFNTHFLFKLGWIYLD